MSERIPEQTLGSLVGPASRYAVPWHALTPLIHAGVRNSSPMAAYLYGKGPMPEPKPADQSVRIDGVVLLKLGEKRREGIE